MELNSELATPAYLVDGPTPEVLAMELNSQLATPVYLVGGSGSDWVVRPTLTAARTVYVDSVGGDNANDGLTPATAWQTYARVLEDLQRFEDFAALYTIQFLGAGPYALPPCDGLRCVTGGYVVWRGDPLARTVHATGTVTGDFALSTIGTSAGLGSDTQHGRFLRFTSGNLNGAIMSIATNTDTSVTVCNGSARSSMGAAANGDSFEIFTPGTTLTGQTFTSLTSFDGGAVDQVNSPRFVFFDLRFTGTVISVRSQLALVACVVATFGGSGSAGAAIQGGITTNAKAPLPDATHNAAYNGAGIVATTLYSFGAHLWGTISGSLRVQGYQGLCVADLTGGRLTACFITRGARLNLSGVSTRASFRMVGTVALEDGSSLMIGGAGEAAGIGYFVVAVASANWITVRDGSVFYWHPTNNSGGVMPSGGCSTSGYAIDVRNGGRAYVIGFTPAVTGGVAGQDLRTTDTAIAANAALGATPSSVDAAPNLWGEVLARVA